MIKNVLFALGLIVMASCTGKAPTNKENDGENRQNPYVIAYEANDSLIGTKMPNFTVTTRFGYTVGMDQLLTKPTNIIAFVDPSDDGHRLIMDKLLNNAELNMLSTDGYMGVVLIDTKDSYADLTLDMIGFNPTWIVACDNDEIKAETMIPLPHNPTFYIVNGEGVIMNEDIPISKLLKFISQQYYQIKE